MAKQKDAELIRTEGQAPSFMVVPPEELDRVNAMIEQYVRPPRLKIVQPMARPPLSEQYAVGDVVLMPSMTLLAKKGEEFTFVPLFFFPEWMTFNPLGIDPTVRERSMDPASTIAMKSRDPNTRREVCPEDAEKKISHREHLNFIAVIVDHPDIQTGTSFAMTFANAEHKTGMSLASMIKMKGVKMFGTRWSAKSSGRSNAKGSWHGLDIRFNGFVEDESLYRGLEGEHDKLLKHYEERTIIIDADDESADNPSTEF